VGQVSDLPGEEASDLPLEQIADLPGESFEGDAPLLFCDLLSPQTAALAT
jgi:hypothetical protein